METVEDILKRALYAKQNGYGFAKLKDYLLEYGETEGDLDTLIGILEHLLKGGTLTPKEPLEIKPVVTTPPKTTQPSKAKTSNKAKDIIEARKASVTVEVKEETQKTNEVSAEDVDTKNTK